MNIILIKWNYTINFIIGIVIGVVDAVLLIVWQDKNLVRFLTTAHSYSNEDVNEVD